ncbi:uncharacterized protein LOC127733980 [Mytilus californianus]|uniref:uncharacterized protein LOC127733980 n=1 Tax=Mytilus californianus TaxID=6549 RepID=UPI00224518DB|nr:uncharacterized protein LOC127733980 [Mytilus californianus]
MERFKCEPCSQLKRYRIGEYWCISCQEPLCKTCFNYHNALTATKEHNMISIEKYKCVLRTLAEIQFTCNEHQEKDLQYFCKSHNCPCCVLCKDYRHQLCQSVVQIKDVIEIGNIKEVCDNFSVRIEKNLNNLKMLTVNANTNISELAMKKQMCYENLQTNRERIEKALDNFESETKREIEKLFQAQEDDVLRQRGDFLEKTKEIEKRRNIIEDIFGINIIPNEKLFLLQQKLGRELHDDESVIETFIASSSKLDCNCIIDTEIEEGNYSMKMTKMFEFKTKPFHQIVDNDSDLETSSSIESEENLTKMKNSPGYRVLPLPPCSEIRKNKALSYKNHFKIKKNDSVAESDIQFIKVIHRNRVLIGGNAMKKLLVYNKSGGRKGEIHMEFPATSAVIIDRNTAAVTAHKAVVIVDTTSYKFKGLIPLRDICIGIAFINGFLVVNCEDRGILIMDLKGKISKTFSLIKGAMLFCSITTETIAAVQLYSSKLIYLNINSSDIKTSKMETFRNINCVTSDSSGSLFVSSCNQNKIGVVNISQESCVLLLNGNERIDNPLSVDFDSESNELVILNNNGRTVFIFERNI